MGTYSEGDDRGSGPSFFERMQAVGEFERAWPLLLEAEEGRPVLPESRARLANARRRVADLMEADPRVERVMRNLADR